MSNTASNIVKVNPTWDRYWIGVEGRGRTHIVRRQADRVRRHVHLRSHKTTVGAEIAILGLLVIGLQILDGVLTGLGMHHFGTSMEGNGFLRAMMDTLGFVPALVLVKAIAIAAVTALCLFADRVIWLRVALRGVIGIYVCMAIIPWMTLLGTLAL